MALTKHLYDPILQIVYAAKNSDITMTMSMEKSSYKIEYLRMITEVVDHNPAIQKLIIGSAK